MSLVLHIAILLFLLLPYTEAKSPSGGSTNINEFCAPTRCSQKGPIIRFPFRLKTQPASCGHEDFELSCLNNTTLIHLPSSTNGSYYVQEISYPDSSVTIIDVNDTTCPLQSLTSLNLTNSKFFIGGLTGMEIAVVKCTEKIKTRDGDQPVRRNDFFSNRDQAVGPIDCMSDDKSFVYIVSAMASMDMMPSSCRTTQTAEIMSPVGQLENAVMALLRTRRIVIEWQALDGCSDCEKSGNFCGFNSTINSTVCYKQKDSRGHKFPVLVIIETRKTRELQRKEKMQAMVLKTIEARSVKIFSPNKQMLDRMSRDKEDSRTSEERENASYGVEDDRSQICEDFLTKQTVAQNTLVGSNATNINQFCPPTRCSKKGPNIRFPFRIKTQPDFCGLEGFELSCSNDKTLLHLPSSSTLHNFYVQEISYLSSRITIVDVNEATCPLQSLLSLNLTGSRFSFNGLHAPNITVMNCTEKIDTRSIIYQSRVAGPIGCMSDDTNFVYVMNSFASMDMVPSYCGKFRTARNLGTSDMQKDIMTLLRTRRIVTGWQALDGCRDCEKSRNFCGFNFTINSTTCFAQKGNKGR
ncbi:hypothetical protein JRO89_XS05G0249600 [Xanthoceras sorbifolium]|uniref:Wall-associated receptor kinase galacturonan-binding domain-containing protein n=1 Tax=Xanthoceras sorbifolium TaxID=99658 RepID=A0ABQ8I399_9ROSI|nr:hypothetical protein JRO89_XS05G0249600 [Xanthoceras sorbifolium]